MANILFFLDFVNLSKFDINWSIWLTLSHLRIYFRNIIVLSRNMPTSTILSSIFSAFTKSLNSCYKITVKMGHGHSKHVDSHEHHENDGSRMRDESRRQIGTESERQVKAFMVCLCSCFRFIHDSIIQPYRASISSQGQSSQDGTDTHLSDLSAINQAMLLKL